MTANLEQIDASVGPTASPEWPIKRFATRCACGSPLRQPSTGRKRVACSEPCRRRRYRLLRKVARRREWLDAWRAERGQGRYPETRISRELRDIRAELAECERALHGGPS